MDIARLLGDPGAAHARYQPIVSVATGAPMAYEALLHVPGADPAEVFAAAARDGRLADLDRFAREVAIREAAGWLGGAALFVKLAAAPGDLPADWLASMRSVAGEAGVPLGQIVLEVVQPPAGEPLDRTARMAIRSRGAGCLVALVGADDARVTRSLVGALLPDFVTLDRALVARLPAPDAVEAAAAVVREAAGARVIAFGVENDAQADAVAALGIPWAQGWKYGHPAAPPAERPPAEPGG